MESIKFQTAHEYDAVKRVHVFHMRMPINGNMLYTTVRMAEEHLYHGKQHAMEMVKYELSHSIADEIRKQAEQFLDTVDLLNSNPAPKSNHATGSAVDSILKDAYQAQIQAQLSMPPIAPLEFTKEELDSLKAKFQAASGEYPGQIGSIYGVPVVEKKLEPTYKEKATSEFEGVEGLDESLWKDGTDGLT